jgi:multidrug resistance efflux pump
VKKERIIMSQLFPPEILKSCSENYFSEQSTSSRIIYVLVIAFLLVAFSLLPFVNVQVSTQSEGIVRSGYEENPIIPVVSGEVILCRLNENQSVNKDDTLLTIATDRINQEIKLLAFRQVEESLIIADLNKLIAGDRTDLRSAICKQDYVAYKCKLDEQTTLVIQAESEYILAETLFNKGITPKHEFEKITHQFQYEKNRYSSVQAQQFTLWHEKLQAIILSLAELAVRLEQLKKEKELYCLKAPIAGTITGYTGIKPGNFIFPNQLIAKIAPETNLLVECFVTPSDIGLIEKGMLASFQFHAFNYNLWGVATGKVNEISNNVITVNNRPFFRIKCQLDQDHLKLKNGYKGNLKKGMTLIGRFKVADRTLFQLLYDKADNWLNPKLKSI